MKRKTRSPIATPAVKILTISLRCLKHRMVKNAKFSRKIWKKISKKESSTPLGNIMGAWPGMNLFKGNKAKSIEAKFVQQTSLKAVANHGGSRVCRMSGKSNSSSSRSNGGQNHLVLEVRNSSWTSQNWLSKKIPIEKRCVCVLLGGTRKYFYASWTLYARLCHCPGTIFLSRAPLDGEGRFGISCLLLRGSRLAGMCKAFLNTNGVFQRTPHRAPLKMRIWKALTAHLALWMGLPVSRMAPHLP